MLDFWDGAMKGKRSPEDFKRFLQDERGYRSGVDFPQAQFYRQNIFFSKTIFFKFNLQ